MRSISLLLLLIPLGIFVYWLLTYEPPVITEVQEPQTTTYFPESSPPVIEEKRLWTVVNNWKEEEDGYVYIYSEPLCSFASKRLEEVQKDWSHLGFLNDTSKEIFKTTKFTNAGENLTKNQLAERYVLTEWLDSEDHRKNLEDPFTHSCIRCENNYCVQLFASY